MQLELHTFPSWEGFSLILEFFLDFRKDILAILAIKSLFPYQRPILLDYWKDNDKFSLSLSNTDSPLFRINVVDKPFTCGRIADWRIWDLRRVLRLYRLAGSHMGLV